MNNTQIDAMIALNEALTKFENELLRIEIRYKINLNSSGWASNHFENAKKLWKASIERGNSR